jgi:hypothetical protein
MAILAELLLELFIKEWAKSSVESFFRSQSRNGGVESWAKFVENVKQSTANFPPFFRLFKKFFKKAPLELLPEIFKV